MIDWILFSLIVTFSVAGVHVITKKDVGITHTIDFTRSIYTFVFLFSLPFALTISFDIPVAYYGVIFIGSLFNLLAVVNLFRVIKYLGVGLAVPLANIELIFTLILGILLFREKLSFIGVMGVITIFIGAYLIEMNGMPLKKRIKKTFSDPLHLYVLSSALFYSLSSLVDRLLVTYMPEITYFSLQPLQYIVIIHFFIFLNFWIIHILSYLFNINNIRNRIIRLVTPGSGKLKYHLKHILRNFRTDKLVVFAALLIVIYRISQIVAISLAPLLIYVIAIKRMSPLVSELIAFKIFKEDNKTLKIISTIIILIGGYLIIYSLM